MKPETAEWIDQAEGDWQVAQREMQAPDPVWNVVCFLANCWSYVRNGRPGRL